MITLHAAFGFVDWTTVPPSVKSSPAKRVEAHNPSGSLGARTAVEKLSFSSTEPDGCSELEAFFGINALGTHEQKQGADSAIHVVDE